MSSTSILSIKVALLGEFHYRPFDKLNNSLFIGKLSADKQIIELFPAVSEEGSGSLVFVDAADENDDSIEVVTSGISVLQLHITDAVAAEGNKGEREDIVQAEKLPTVTVKGLFYNVQDNLNTHKNKVKSKPSLDEKIQEGITELNKILQRKEYKPLHPVGHEVKELLSGAVKYANDSGTSLKAARELLDSSLAVYKKACDSIADKFELSSESTKALAEHEKIERERLEAVIKRKNMEEANAKREEGIEMIEKSIDAAKIDTVRVISKQAKEEEERVLIKLTEQKKEIEENVDSELNELHMFSHNCQGDIFSLEQSLNTLEQSAEAAFNKYTGKDKDLCLHLQQNRSEQEKLRKRLEELQNQESTFENDRDERRKTQQRAEKTKERAKGELENWKNQIEELYRCCQAAITVLSQFREGAFKLINSSIESKEQEEKRLQELDILAHRTFRDALVAASVDCKESIEQAEQSLAVIKERRDRNKASLKDAARKGVNFLVEEIKEELRKAKENYSQCKSQKAQNEMKLEEYKKEIDAVDDRLQSLGQALESLDSIYKRHQSDVEAAWAVHEDDDDGGSLTSLDSI